MDTEERERLVTEIEELNRTIKEKEELLAERDDYINDLHEALSEIKSQANKYV